MKTKTILPILLVIALTITLIPKQAHSLQGTYTYVSLSYGRGWWPWACVMEEGKNADYTRDFYAKNFCGARYCPFESATLIGQFMCSATDRPAVSGTPCGIIAEISIPEDIKLVTDDGYVIDDEICAGDQFWFSKGTEKGEWWERGGHYDSPPIHWVDDVEKLVLDIMDYHEKTTTTKEDLYSNPFSVPDGYVDDVANIPVYTVIEIDFYEVTGNMVCSIKEKSFEIEGATESMGYYEATDQDVSFNADFVIECMYYYFGSSRGRVVEGQRNRYSYFTYQVPTIIQTTNRNFMTHNIKYNSIEDFFRVGTISFNKNIKVVQPVAEPELTIKTILTDTELDHGETTYAHLLITNNGAAAITLKDITSNVNHEFIYCDKETLEPDEQADCALTLTPDTEADITATVNFEYRRCGKRIESSKKQTSSTITVHPLERCTKSTDCKDGKVCCNRICRTESKGACDDFNGDGTFEWSYY